MQNCCTDWQGRWCGAWCYRWEALSVEAQELVMGLLNYDPDERLTAQQVLAFDLHCLQQPRSTWTLMPDLLFCKCSSPAPGCLLCLHEQHLGMFACQQIVTALRHSKNIVQVSSTHLHYSN